MVVTLRCEETKLLILPKRYSYFIVSLAYSSKLLQRLFHLTIGHSRRQQLVQLGGDLAPALKSSAILCLEMSVFLGIFSYTT
jgi:hypothetical protein